MLTRVFFSGHNPKPSNIDLLDYPAQQIQFITISTQSKKDTLPLSTTQLFYPFYQKKSFSACVTPQGNILLFGSVGEALNHWDVHYLLDEDGSLLYHIRAWSP